MRPLKRRRRAQRGSDPAPSRLSYRLQRLALTPAVRRGFTLGVPVAAIAVMGTLTFADEARRAQVFAWIDEARAKIESREEFMVRLMSMRLGPARRGYP